MILTKRTEIIKFQVMDNTIIIFFLKIKEMLMQNYFLNGAHVKL